MIYDAVEHAITTAKANFSADLSALASAKNESGVISDVTVHGRLDATEFHSEVDRLAPGLGIYGNGASTQAKHPDIRESVVTLFFDYYAIGADATDLGKQVELAAEAILQTVDAMTGGSAGIINAGGADGSVSVTVLPITRIKGGKKTYEGRCVVQVPAQERDTGL